MQVALLMRNCVDYPLLGALASATFGSERENRLALGVFQVEARRLFVPIKTRKLSAHSWLQHEVLISFFRRPPERLVLTPLPTPHPAISPARLQGLDAQIARSKNFLEL